MDDLKRNGFVPLFRQVMKWDLWDRPLHFFKIFCFLLMRASYEDTHYTKRGQLETSHEELMDICAAGWGRSRTEITSQQVRQALKYFENECDQCPIKITDGRYDELRITLLNYNALANDDRNHTESAGNFHRNFTESSPNADRNDTESSPNLASYIYNNNKQINKKNNTKNNFYRKGASPTRFNNFTPRETDYDAILKRKKEEARKFAQAYREEI